MSPYSVESVLADEELLGTYPWNRSKLIDFGDYMKRLAMESGRPIVISIFLDYQRIYQIGLEGSSEDNDTWIQRKINTVYAIRHSSLFLRAHIEGEIQQRLHIKNHLGDLAVCGGGIPILQNGSVKGIILVSGLPHYEDHLFIMENFKNWSNEREHR